MVILCISPTQMGTSMRQTWSAVLSLSRTLKLVWQLIPRHIQKLRSPSADLDNLKRKIDEGARRAITQFFFEPDVYLKFRDRAAASGITIPIVPGILPVTNFAQVMSFSKLCGTSVPGWMADRFDGLDEDPETRQLVAASVAIELSRCLVSEGAEDIHFYTLNRADLSYAICHVLGLRPNQTKNEQKTDK